MGSEMCIRDSYNIVLNLLVHTHPIFCKVTLLDPFKNSFLKFKKHVSICQGKDEITHLLEKLDKDAKARYVMLGDYENIQEYNKESGGIMPFEIIVFDEFAVYDDKEGHELIAKLVATCRAVGIYFVFATQRSSVDVINGVIRANFDMRVCLRAVSYTHLTLPTIYSV